GLHHQRSGVGRRDGGHLADRRRVAVVVHPDAIEQRRGGTAGPHGGELTPQPIQRRVHAGLHLLQHGLHDDLLFEGTAALPHGAFQLIRGEPWGSPFSYVDVTIEPTGSPHTIRRMLPGRVRSKTTIGSLFSMHSEMAVVSITASCLFSASMYVTV